MTDQVKLLLTRLRAAMRQEDDLRDELTQLGLDTPEKLQDAMIELVNGD